MTAHDIPLLRLHAAEKLLVPLNGEVGTTETALVLLDPLFPDHGLVVLEDARNAISTDDLAEGWLTCRRKTRGMLGDLDRTPGVIENLALRGMLRDRDIPAFVLAGQLPELEFTNIPIPPIGIYAGPSPVATAGVATNNNSGVFGVTGPYHSIVASSSGPIVGTTITIGSRTAGSLSGVIQTADQISDSCFISLASPGLTGLRPLKGRLGSLTPRMNQPADFEGITSGKTPTTIVGWSPDLPFVQPYSQLKVFTTPDTNRGDSGAALVDSDGYLIGFAFYRTSLTGAIQYSAWVWAESVYQAHGLQ